MEEENCSQSPSESKKISDSSIFMSCFDGISSIKKDVPFPHEKMASKYDINFDPSDNNQSTKVWLIERAWSCIILKHLEKCVSISNKYGAGISVFKMLQDKYNGCNCEYHYIQKNSYYWDDIIEKIERKRANNISANLESFFPKNYDGKNNIIVAIWLSSRNKNIENIDVRLFNK